MSVLTVDVGIRNLAVCCMQKKSKAIMFWELVDTTGDAPKACAGVLRTGSPCTRNACLVLGDGSCVCGVHGKGAPGAKPLKRCKVKSMTMQSIAQATIRAVTALAERRATDFENIERVAIELQPRVNNKMKFTSHVIFAVLAQHFEGKKVELRFVGAKRKLLAHAKQSKDTYAKRKKLAIACASEWLDAHAPEWRGAFDECKKKDDMADCLLMAIDEA